MRSIALGRKNWIHFGHQNAGPKIAAILSVLESCHRLNQPKMLPRTDATRASQQIYPPPVHTHTKSTSARGVALTNTDDVWMVEADLSGGVGAEPRRRSSAAECRRMEEETLEAGASVAKVALKYGVNANQVFQWRRLYRDGKLGATPANAMKLLPVSVVELEKSTSPEPVAKRCSSSGAIYIELRGRFESVSKAVSIAIWFVPYSRTFARDLASAGTRIWIAADVTDMRRGFHGLSAQVQTVLEQQPLSGHVFVFPGRRGDILQILWSDGGGMYLPVKRLERGRFIWPQASSGTVSLSRAQLSMLLEDIDWRAPARTAERVMGV